MNWKTIKTVYSGVQWIEKKGHYLFFLLAIFMIVTTCAATRSYAASDLDQIHYRWRNDNGYESGNSPRWGVGDCAYRKRVSISAGTGAGTDYTVHFPIGESSGSTGDDFHLGGNAETDFADVRITDSDGSTLLDYWIEDIAGVSPNLSADVWVEVQDDLGSARDVYVYYSNPVIPDVSSATNTLPFYDDFSGDLSQWTIDPENTDAVYIDGSDRLRHDPDASQTKNSYYDTRIQTNSFTIEDGVIEYDLYFSGSNRNIHQMGWRVNWTGSFTNGYAWRLQTAAADGGFFELVSGAWQHRGTNIGSISSGTWYSIRVIFSITIITPMLTDHCGHPPVIPQSLRLIILFPMCTALI